MGCQSFFSLFETPGREDKKNNKKSYRVGYEIEENLQFPSPLTPPIMPFGNGRFSPNSDIVCCLFSFPHPCRLSYISYVLHQGYALICNRCRTPARNIHSNRQIGLFGPSLFLGTMTSADSSHFDFLGATLCEASWDKSLLFPRLPL